MSISDDKELGEALKRGDNYIEITGDLAKKVIRIKATGNVAWAICFAAIDLAVAGFLLAMPTGGMSGAAVGIVAAPAAVGVLGGAATASAITIAIAAGGVGALNRLREYKIVSSDNDRLVISKS